MWITRCLCYAGDAVPQGVYIRSFAQGLDDVLQDYRQALLDIESCLLADPHLTAAYVQMCLEEVRHYDSLTRSSASVEYH